MTLGETIKDTQAQTRPPEKLSDLIRLAVKDARRLNPDEYWPNAGIYHERSVYTRWDTDVYGPLPPPNACHACVAGAVIAGTLKVSPDVEASPGDFDHGWEGSLFALESIRSGRYLYAYYWHHYGTDAWHHYGTDAPRPKVSKELLYLLKTLTKDYPPLEPGFQNWAQFKVHIDSLEAIADIFEQKGL